MRSYQQWVNVSKRFLVRLKTLSFISKTSTKFRRFFDVDVSVAERDVFVSQFHKISFRHQEGCTYLIIIIIIVTYPSSSSFSFSSSLLPFLPLLPLPFLFFLFFLFLFFFFLFFLFLFFLFSFFLFFFLFFFFFLFYFSRRNFITYAFLKIIFPEFP